MEEKILIKSKPGINSLMWIALVYFVVGFVVSCYLCVGRILPTYFFTSICYVWDPAFYVFWPSVLLVVVGLLMGNSELVVTDKRVYGTASFKKRVDLPLDSISAVGTSFFKGISVSSSSGSVSFVAIRNSNEIHACITNLLLERQNKTTANTIIKQEISQSNADELKKYKDLLDSGVISQEEFDAKKKQLLGL